MGLELLICSLLPPPFLPPPSALLPADTVFPVVVYLAICLYFGLQRAWGLSSIFFPSPSPLLLAVPHLPLWDVAISSLRSGFLLLVF